MNQEEYNTSLSEVCEIGAEFMNEMRLKVDGMRTDHLEVKAQVCIEARTGGSGQDHTCQPESYLYKTLGE